ncbi:MAG: hypothetical protein N4A46_12320 [Schleiferiaceae bacterium]|jgi:hypothetical protein|nr:hypothetical protein [Schleiferiaceae bacterium]
MDKKYRKYIINLGIISVIIALLTIGLYTTILKAHFNIVFPFVILYFFLFNSFQHFKLLKSSKGNPRVFHTNYMAWFGIKLFLNLSFVIVFVLLNRAQALSFVLFFAFCYMVYTTYEVIALSKTLRSENVK